MYNCHLYNYNLEGERIAVIVGIDKYHDDKIEELHGAENDAREIFECLKNYGNFKIEQDRHLLLGQNATCQKIRKSIGEICYEASTHNLILFYFSGHGFEDGFKNVYIAPYDISKDEPFSCGINIHELIQIFSNYYDLYSPVKKVTVLTILDHCYSGSAAKGSRSLTSPEGEYENSLKEFAGDGRVVLASSGENEQAREIQNCDHIRDMPPHTHGVFSFNLIKGLEGGAADENGIITLGNLHRYVEDKMQGDLKQKTKFLAEGTSQSNIENVKVAVAAEKYTQAITTIIENAKSSVTAGSGIESYFQAAKQIESLRKLDPKNARSEELIKSIDVVLEKYNGPIGDWLSDNSGRVRTQIENGFPGLYPRLFELERHLSFEGLTKVNELNLCLLNAVYDVINGFSEIDTFVRRCRSCAKRFGYSMPAK